MGQKIQPTGFRLPVARNWTSKWYASHRDFAKMLNEDIKVRNYLKERLKSAAVSKILIERPAKNAKITIHSARPGVVIGKKGEDIESLKSVLAKMLGVSVHVNIEEVRKPELDAQLVSASITQQLEKRIMFRRAMKRAIQNAMRLGAQGIKIMSSGRLNGAEIARCEWYREGRVPLHTIKADIDYGFSEANTTYGIIGVKVWIYKGEMLTKSDIVSVPQEADLSGEDQEKTVKKARSRKKRSESGEIATSTTKDSKEKEPVEKLTRKKVRRVASKKPSVGDDEKSGAKAEKKEKPATKKLKTGQSETGESK